MFDTQTTANRANNKMDRADADVIAHTRDIDRECKDVNIDDFIAYYR